MLITILLIHRARRRKAEALLADRNQRLEESEISLRQLSGQLINAQEEERRRIARDLHDDLNQQVAALKLSLGNIKRGIPDSLDNVRGALIGVQDRLSALSNDIRHVSHELHPGLLEHCGLVAALRAHCREFSALARIDVDFETDLVDFETDFSEPVAYDVALCIYRIAQESLRNATKHGHASRVRIGLTKSGESVQLTVFDNGIGFEVENGGKSGGLGLRSIQERVRLFDGRLEVRSQPGGGTTLIATGFRKHDPIEHTKPSETLAPDPPARRIDVEIENPE